MPSSQLLYVEMRWGFIFGIRVLAIMIEVTISTGIQVQSEGKSNPIMLGPMYQRSFLLLLLINGTECCYLFFNRLLIIY